jgi:MYXO-CTERM domain-containing protein
VVSENWYPDWRATVDGQAAPVHRGNQALITVALPPGARDVVLEFASPSYQAGKVVSLVALLAALALVVAPGIRRRGSHA